MENTEKEKCIPLKYEILIMGSMFAILTGIWCHAANNFFCLVTEALEKKHKEGIK
jgi:hypothetical protein